MYRGVNKPNRFEQRYYEEHPYHVHRISVLMPSQMYDKMDNIADIIATESAVVMRMLVSLSLRFAERNEIIYIAQNWNHRTHGSASWPRYYRIPDKLKVGADEIMTAGNLSISSTFRALVYWALENLENYSFKNIFGVE